MKDDEKALEGRFQGFFYTPELRKKEERIVFLIISDSVERCIHIRCSIVFFKHNHEQSKSQFLYCKKMKKTVTMNSPNHSFFAQIASDDTAFLDNDFMMISYQQKSRNTVLWQFYERSKSQFFHFLFISTGSPNHSFLSKTRIEMLDIFFEKIIMFLCGVCVEQQKKRPGNNGN